MQAQWETLCWQDGYEAPPIDDQSSETDYPGYLLQDDGSLIDRDGEAWENPLVRDPEAAYLVTSFEQIDKDRFLDDTDFRWDLEVLLHRAETIRNLRLRRKLNDWPLLARRVCDIDLVVYIDDPKIRKTLHSIVKRAEALSAFAPYKYWSPARDSECSTPRQPDDCDERDHENPRVDSTHCDGHTGAPSVVSMRDLCSHTGSGQEECTPSWSLRSERQMLPSTGVLGEVPSHVYRDDEPMYSPAERNRRITEWDIQKLVIRGNAKAYRQHILPDSPRGRKTPSDRSNDAESGEGDSPRGSGDEPESNYSVESQEPLHRRERSEAEVEADREEAKKIVQQAQHDAAERAQFRDAAKSATRDELQTMLNARLAKR